MAQPRSRRLQMFRRKLPPMTTSISSLLFVTLAEIGDKTQPATVSLAVEYGDALPVLLGTTIGMVVADGIGIAPGATLGRRVPDVLIRVVSAGVFIGFGLLGVCTELRHGLLPSATAGLILSLTGLTFVDMFVPGAPLSRLVAPARILLAAVMVVVGSPILARCGSGPRLRRITAARLTIASGCLLLGIAVQGFIEHVK